MYIADPLFITLLSMLEPNSSLIQVKPKQLFPEIEPEHYITRRDQFALRDELQKEKAEKREAAKVEKEAKALAKAKSGPAKRGRPPKKSVESQGKSADQPEPADESCVNNAGTIDKSPMDNNASRAKKKARTGESKLVNQIKQSRAKKLVTSVETVGEAPDSNPNPPKEDAEPAEEESTLVKQSTRTGAKKAAAGPGDNLPKHKRAKKATAPETVDNSPMEDAQTPDIDIKPRRRSRAKKAAEPETIDKSPTDKSPMEDAKNQDIDIKLPKRSRAKKVAELETIDKSPTDKSPTDKSPRRMPRTGTSTSSRPGAVEPRRLLSLRRLTRAPPTRARTRTSCPGAVEQRMSRPVTRPRLWTTNARRMTTVQTQKLQPVQPPRDGQERPRRVQVGMSQPRPAEAVMRSQPRIQWSVWVRAWELWAWRTRWW